MFYCDECAKKKGWPQSIRKDYGPCEVCRKTTACNDVPSKDLPPGKKSDTRKFKKGDRVEVITKAGMEYGVVASIRGDKIRAILDGAREQISGPSDAFRISDKPVPRGTTATPADKYGIIKYKRVDGHEGDGFSAIITKDEKPILKAYNEGIGGECMVYPLKNIPASEADEFYGAVEKWFTIFTNGAKSHGCAEDLFVSWYINQRPYGVTAKEYLKDLKRGS